MSSMVLINKINFNSELITHQAYALLSTINFNSVFLSNILVSVHFISKQSEHNKAKFNIFFFKVPFLSQTKAFSCTFARDE